MAEDKGYKKFTVADYFLSLLGFDRGQDAGLMVATCMKAANPTPKAEVWPQLEFKRQNQNEEAPEPMIPHLQEMLNEGLDTHGL
ncbi:MAG: hypothetical protein MK052_01670 [Alphaproteobacteria bacterium]|nr:hypothetical protein [Alphaproteobacteria bacterium]